MSFTLTEKSEKNVEFCRKQKKEQNCSNKYELVRLIVLNYHFPDSLE